MVRINGFRGVVVGLARSDGCHGCGDEQGRVVAGLRLDEHGIALRVEAAAAIGDAERD